MSTTVTGNIYAGNLVRITDVFECLDTPGGAPTAVVCVTDDRGVLVGTLTSPTVTVNGVFVTVVANWTIPDGQDGGTYIATVKTSGTLVAADQVRIPVAERIHTDPHV